MTTSKELRTMMVDTQVRPSDVTKYPIISAMLEVPREVFVPPAAEPVAYMDAPVRLGGGREMPEGRTLARMLDVLDIELDDEVLIVGGGLGYSAAVVARMAASVVMVEEDAAMVTEAETLLGQRGIVNVAVLNRPLTEAAETAGPFDVILIEGAVETIPDTLTDQLREGGRIAAIFQSGALGEARLGRRIDGRVGWRFAFNASAPVLPGFEIQREFTL